MRVFYKTPSSLLEVSESFKRYKTGEESITLGAGESIILGSEFPFNHLYFKLGTTLNSNDETMVIQYWGNYGEWVNAVDVNDQTLAFSQSGFIEFTPNKDTGWQCESTNYAGDLIPDLEDVVVYDKYWIKITFSGALTEVDFQWIGNLFSDDVDLFSEFPVFNDSTFLTAFEAGKTDWQEQHVRASELIIQDLKRKKVIFSENQILEREIFAPASISKTAEIIFNSFGRDYSEQRDNCRKEYDKRMDLSQFVVDKDGDAIKDKSEVVMSQGWLSR